MTPTPAPLPDSGPDLIVAFQHNPGFGFAVGIVVSIGILISIIKITQDIRDFLNIALFIEEKEEVKVKDAIQVNNKDLEKQFIQLQSQIIALQQEILDIQKQEDSHD